MPVHKKIRLSSFQIIILGFMGVILMGACLLVLPVSSREGVTTPFHEALFTSTSAVCVTGLVVQDTASYWSYFGQAVILVLIQIGGLGVVTVAAMISLLSGRKISLKQRSTMQEAISAPQMGGIVKLTGFIVRTTLIIEFIGAIFMLPVFCKEQGLKGIWLSFFHSISAFCNAGFDLLGTEHAKYVSLTSYMGHPVINITIMALIIIGGIGFLTWDDICMNKYRVKNYRMQSKVILVTTILLILIPTIYFYFGEFQQLEWGERIFASFFQAVTPRTAGFNTADLTIMTGAGQCIIIILMLIGGSPGSTAGGIKTTTFAVLFANAIAVFQKKDYAHFFGRRMEEDVIRNASTILTMYLALFLSGGWIISVLEGIELGTCLFETASAIGTVGLTLGITPELGIVSQGILIILMFFGRVGGLTLIYAAVSGTQKKLSRLPQGKIMVG